jgi:hypothetical protein
MDAEDIEKAFRSAITGGKENMPESEKSLAKNEPISAPTANDTPPERPPDHRQPRRQRPSCRMIGRFRWP